jgi:hypothetical protein
MSSFSLARKVRGRPVRSITLSGILLLALAQPALAWDDPDVISESGHASAFLQSTAAVDGERIHVAYSDRAGGMTTAVYRRSPRGETWKEPVILSDPGAFGAVSFGLDADEANVDVVIGEFDASGRYVLWYRRSLNHGRDWQAPKRLTPLAGDAGKADVARDGDRVTVIWTDRDTGKIFVRTSTDGGATFGVRRQVAQTNAQPYPGQDAPDGHPVIGDADGTINIAWNANNHTIRARRSRDGGATWGPVTALATNADGQEITLMAVRDRIVVGYTATVNGFARATQRRSRNSGGTWLAAGHVAGKNSSRPIFDFHHSRLFVTYGKCLTGECQEEATYHRLSLNFGADWLGIQRASLSSDTPRAFPVGLGAADGGRTVVLYVRETSSGDHYLYGRKR